MQSKLEILLFRTSGGLMSRIRIALYRALGMTVGDHCRLEKIRIRRPRQIRLGRHNAISEGTWLWPLDADYEGIRIQIGDYNYFNRGITIDACGFITLGSHIMIGPGCYITDSNHTMAPGQWVAESPMDVGRVEIGDGCWLGCNVTILKDVALGRKCIVAAGSVVTKSFPAGSLIGGIPAKLIRTVTETA